MVKRDSKFVLEYVRCGSVFSWEISCAFYCKFFDKLESDAKKRGKRPNCILRCLLRLREWSPNSRFDKHNISIKSHCIELQLHCQCISNIVALEWPVWSASSSSSFSWMTSCQTQPITAMKMQPLTKLLGPLSTTLRAKLQFSFVQLHLYCAMRSLEQSIALLPWCSSVCLSVCLGRACTLIIRCTLARI